MASGYFLIERQARRLDQVGKLRREGGARVDSVAAIWSWRPCRVGFAIAQPAEFSLVPVIGGDPESLTQLNGWVETARYAGMTAGPLIGGVLAGLGGTDVAMLVNSATFVAVAVAALLLHARRPPRPAADDGEPDRARDGVVYLFQDRALALVMSVVFISLLFMTASATAEVFFIKEDLQASDALYGLLFGAWTGGMVAGALVISRLLEAALVAHDHEQLALRGERAGANRQRAALELVCAEAHRGPIRRLGGLQHLAGVQRRLFAEDARQARQDRFSELAQLLQARRVEWALDRHPALDHPVELIGLQRLARRSRPFLPRGSAPCLRPSSARSSR